MATGSAGRDQCLVWRIVGCYSLFKMLPLVLQVFLEAALDEVIGCSLVGRFEKHRLEQKNSGLCNIVIEKTRKCQNWANSVVCWLVGW